MGQPIIYGEQKSVLGQETCSVFHRKFFITRELWKEQRSAATFIEREKKKFSLDSVASRR